MHFTMEKLKSFSVYEFKYVIEKTGVKESLFMEEYLYFKFHKNPLANNRDIRLESLSSDTLYNILLHVFFFR
jgi:hypothetical protein